MWGEWDGCLQGDGQWPRRRGQQRERRGDQQGEVWRVCGGGEDPGSPRASRPTVPGLAARLASRRCLRRPGRVETPSPFQSTRHRDRDSDSNGNRTSTANRTRDHTATATADRTADRRRDRHRNSGVVQIGELSECGNRNAEKVAPGGTAACNRMYQVPKRIQQAIAGTGWDKTHYRPPWGSGGNNR